RAGWVRWYDSAPAGAPRVGRAGPGARVVLGRGAYHLTGAGPKNTLGVHAVHRPSEDERLVTLGGEPLPAAFPRGPLAEPLDSRNQQVKGLLRDQGVIAGIGNAYSDEILHAARLSPFALTRSLDTAARDRLYASVGTVLTAAVQAATGKDAAELKAVKRSGM